MSASRLIGPRRARSPGASADLQRARAVFWARSVSFADLPRPGPFAGCRCMRRSRARCNSRSATDWRACCNVVPGGNSNTSDLSNGFLIRTGSSSGAGAAAAAGAVTRCGVGVGDDVAGNSWATGGEPGSAALSTGGARCAALHDAIARTTTSAPAAPASAPRPKVAELTPFGGFRRTVVGEATLASASISKVAELAPAEVSCSNVSDPVSRDAADGRALAARGASTGEERGVDSTGSAVKCCSSAARARRCMSCGLSSISIVSSSSGSSAKMVRPPGGSFAIGGR
jgi:hypothetical protein